MDLYSFCTTQKTVKVERSLVQFWVERNTHTAPLRHTLIWNSHHAFGDIEDSSVAAHIGS